METIVIVTNGSLDESADKALKKVDTIIAADGGANALEKLGIIPDYLIGDLDSINASVLQRLEKEKTEIKKDTNQDKTDTELAVELAQSLKPKEIIILGALGTRMDHTLANIMNLPPGVKIVDKNNEIVIVDKTIELTGPEVVSVIALSDVKGLTYTGLHWQVSNRDVPAGWVGVSNKLVGNTGRISLDSGRILAIRSRD